MTLVYAYMQSPVGRLLVAGDADHLRYISFAGGRRAREAAPEWRRDDNAFPNTLEQLRAYFAGELTEFDLPLYFEGTPFQKMVWSTLREIPYGQTWSYGRLAVQIGRPSASRAVGAANGANPLPIVAPCHRVVGSDGSLTGFGGGLETKEYLLRHEQGVSGSAQLDLELMD